MVTDVELRRIKNIADLEEARSRQLNVSITQLRAGQALVERKLAGRRIGQRTTEVNKAFTFLSNLPENLRRLPLRAGRRPTQPKPKPTLKITPKKVFIGPVRPAPIVKRAVLERTKTQQKITSFGRRVQGSIERAREKTLRTLSPSFKREANKQLEEARKVDNSFDRLGKNISNFNKRFGGKDLNPTQFRTAERQAKNLKSEITSFDKLLEKTKKDQKDRIKEEQKLGVFKPFVLGVISSPFSVASFTTGVLTRNVEKEILESLRQIPAAFKEAPVTTVGLLAGELVGSALIFKSGNLLKRVTSPRTLLRSRTNFILEKPTLRKGKTKAFPVEVEFRINKPAIKTFARARLKERGVDFNKLNKVDQNFILGQIEATIVNQPEKFIPKARQAALTRAKARNLRDLIRRRLIGEFDDQVLFLKNPSKKLLKKLTPTQRLTLQRLSSVQSRIRIKKAIKKRLKLKKEKPILLNKKEIRFRISRIRNLIKADPTLILSKS